eukprot:m.337737 g.337737  ORF g.337737 m.337737 type:complete len:564 (-) comp18220_c0_seq1:131-1822(-)
MSTQTFEGVHLPTHGIRRKRTSSKKSVKSEGLVSFPRGPLPAVYIFPRNQEGIQAWRIRNGPSREARHIGTLVENAKFLVDVIIYPWVRLRMADGSYGWATMQAKDKAFLVPFNPLAHSGLQENDKLRRQYIEGGIFGKFTSRRLIEPARVDDTKDSSGRSFTAFSWQRQRGTNRDYVTTLERRRSDLRRRDLSENPLLLVEWIELIKELDAVVRHGFRSSVQSPSQQGGDIPRSVSLLNVPPAPRKQPAATQRERPRKTRPRSLSFASATTKFEAPKVEEKPDTYINDSDVVGGDSDVAGLDSDAPIDSETGDSQADDTLDSQEESQEEEEKPELCMHANNPLTCKYGKCGARETPNTTVALCMHANNPLTCKYGSCGERNKTSSTIAATPPVEVKVNVQPTNSLSDVVAPPKSLSSESIATVTESQPKKEVTLCMHFNDPQTCKYGKCAETRKEAEEFEKMVQEELEKIRMDNTRPSSALGTRESAPKLTDETPGRALPLVTPVRCKSVGALSPTSTSTSMDKKKVIKIVKRLPRRRLDFAGTRSQSVEPEPEGESPSAWL